MKNLFFALVIVIGLCYAKDAADSVKSKKCSLTHQKIMEDWIYMAQPCVAAMRSQVQQELDAAINYMAMGAYFAQDTVNRPGFSKYFFEAASEEREHAIKIIEYLLMRGNHTRDLQELITEPINPEKMEWKDGVTALNDALKLEAKVTLKIRKLIEICEGESKPEDLNPEDSKPFNDYHLVDYLTGEFLTEQLQGERKLAGMISTLVKMKGTHGALGEFLYDKKLLNNELL